MSRISTLQRSRLSLFDVVSLVIGAVIGADIYVVAGIGAPLIGPALIVVWVIAGIAALLIALCFAQCAAIEPISGGSYAYVESTLGPAPALVVGLALYLAEWSALAVFPVAAASYLTEALQLSAVEIVGFKIAWVALFTAANLVGVRAAGLIDDAFTAAKLIPLALLVGAVLLLSVRSPGIISAHLVPLAPLGWGSFGAAFTLVFWAYAGFEVAPLPAAAISNPATTMPRAMILGMLISIGFYLLTNLAVFIVVPWQRISHAAAPLALAMAAASVHLGLFASLGIGLMTVGALISIGGVAQATTLTSADLAATLAEAGVFPRILARRSHRFGTPTLALLIQGATTLSAALVFNLTALIAIAVFYLVLVYFATAVATRILLARHPGCALRVPGISLVPIVAALAALAVGVGIPMSTIGLGAGLLAVAALASLVDRLSRGADARNT